MSELLDAFWSYEQALGANDMAGLDHWFLNAPDTVRAEGSMVLSGHAAISDFRRGRSGGAPARTVERVHEVRIAEDVAVLTAETLRADESRGMQTQVWRLTGEVWRIAAAHVSAVQDRVADEAPDPAVWRVVGEPLVAGAEEGPLAGVRTAVKDLFAVAGQRIGGGNPQWLAEAPVEHRHADAVRELLSAGAQLAYIAQTDELAFSLAGTNIHYGTPVNPAAPGRITGGSSSGPAAAVARGWADLGLATDTAGSIRVPASYCGLYGWRPTHGAVPTGGLLPLAPSFDTAGLLARDPDLLCTAAKVLLPRDGAAPMTTLLVDDALTALAEPEVRASFEAACRALSLRTGLELVRTDTGMAPTWRSGCPPSVPSRRPRHGPRTGSGSRSTQARWGPTSRPGLPGAAGSRRAKSVTPTPSSYQPVRSSSKPSRPALRSCSPPRAARPPRRRDTGRGRDRTSRNPPPHLPCLARRAARRHHAPAAGPRPPGRPLRDRRAGHGPRPCGADPCMKSAPTPATPGARTSHTSTSAARNARPAP